MSSTSATAPTSSLESLLRRDRAIVLVALCLVAALSWTHLARLAASPQAMPMGHSGALTAIIPLFLMWVVMMVGMMTPSVAPIVLLYARVARSASDRETPFADASWFVGGYLAAWIGFSIIATLSQWGLGRTQLLSPMTATVAPPVAAVLLIVAGLYQLTPAKAACLRHCQSPLLFIQRHGGFQPGRTASLKLGLRHGAYCIGCCWALMLLLFVGGVMNLLWAAAIGALILAEKLTPGPWLARFGAAAFIVTGVTMLV